MCIIVHLYKLICVIYQDMLIKRRQQNGWTKNEGEMLVGEMKWIARSGFMFIRIENSVFYCVAMIFVTSINSGELI